MDQVSPKLHDAPVISVIVPVYQGADTIRRCLDSVLASTHTSFELIVIDDGSTDATVEIIRAYANVRLLNQQNQGPAVARNAGANVARASILYFLDADIVMRPDTLALALQSFEQRPEICAVFGSFDKHPFDGDFVSDYKNLLHHYTHQTANSNSSSFCGGFSAIRRDVFLDCGGFDPSYRYLEDVEFGYRLSAAGHIIWLRADMQLAHCKRYTLASLIRSDVYGRAIPWTRLILARHVLPNDLSTRTHHVLSVILSFALVASLALPGLWRLLALPLAAAGVIANRRFLGFLRRERGLLFAIRGSGMNLLGYLYSGSGAGFAVLSHVWSRMLPARIGILETQAEHREIKAEGNSRFRPCEPSDQVDG